jgi:hypothetical protein
MCDIIHLPCALYEHVRRASYEIKLAPAAIDELAAGIEGVGRYVHGEQRLRIIILEVLFLKAVHFDVNVQASEYARIYFELHDRCCTKSTARATKPLAVSAARSLSINSENTMPAEGHTQLQPMHSPFKGRKPPQMGHRGVAALA